MVAEPLSERQIKAYRKSEVIFQEDSLGQEMYIIRSGKVRLVLGQQGQSIELNTLEPGEYFGEMALIDAAPRSAKAIAEEDNTELEVLNRGGFLQMIREYPEFALDIMRELSQRVRRGNILYYQVIREAMAPFCPRNCLRKTMDSFVRASIIREEQEIAREAVKTERWKCGACDYIYDARMGDPSMDIPSGVRFEELPESWVCPVCGAAKSTFQKIDS